MSRATYSAAMTASMHDALSAHLLQHYQNRRLDEDLCFVLWRPSYGRSRKTAIITEIIYPEKGHRNVHGNASFNASYLEHVMERALEAEAGIAFIHSHPVPGWQNMSRDDINAEKMLAPRVFGLTGLPLVGLTMGTDGVLSARFWIKNGQAYDRHWCQTVRVVGDSLQVYFSPEVPTPVFREELQRTYSAWGEVNQHLLARLRPCVVGAGSVGAVVAETLVRQGTEDVMLMDFDKVKKHNLDRLLHATAADIGELKVDVATKILLTHATAQNIDIENLPFSICNEDGFRAALDCDVIFSCVDRPWPRAVMNLIAYAHLIPVIDGGIGVRVTKDGKMRGAEWRAHIVGPGKPCLECLKQYDVADVSLERTGLLDDPAYIQNLPPDHFARRNQNVFAFSASAAGLLMMQYLLMVVASGGVHSVGGQTYSLSTGTIDLNATETCNEGCLFPGFSGLGDHAGYQVTSTKKS